MAECQITKQDALDELSRRGVLTHLLLPHQKLMYKSVWDAINDKTAAQYVINCSRRYGKSFVMCLVAIEFALRYPGVQIRFAAPTAKALKKIVYPIFRIILSKIPKDIHPTFKAQDDVFQFHNESEIHLAGTDGGHSENLRGTASDLNILDEAGFMDDLKYILQSILIPQTLTTGGTSLITSTPPISPAHYFVELVQIAKRDNRYLKQTIYDNTSLTPDTIELYAKEAGGKQSTTFKREYLAEFVVDSERSLTPEWNTEQYVVKELPEMKYYQHFDKYVAMDIGLVHYTYVLFGVYDFLNARFVVEAEWFANGPTLTTDVIAKTIKNKQTELWNGQQPWRRISDNNNKNVLNDLNVLHNMPFIATSKEQLHSMVNKLRMFIKEGRLLVHEDCQFLIGCLESGVWDKHRKAFDESGSLGHFDATAAVMYLVRNLDEWHNPVPSNVEWNEATFVNKGTGVPQSEWSKVFGGNK